MGVWDGLKSLGILNYENQMTKIEFSPNQINEHFINIASMYNKSFTTSLPEKIAEITTSSERFTLQNITPDEVMKIWRTMKKRTKTHPDPTGISNKMISLILPNPNVAEAITQLINESFELSHVPKLLKTSRVVPVPKSKQVQSLSDVRPITVSPVIAKIKEKAAYIQLNEHVTYHNLLWPLQFGFRKGYSTVHAHITVTDYMYKCISENKICVLLAIDMCKAFDMLKSDIVIHKLPWYNIDDEWLTSYLKHRHQYVRIANNDSDIMEIKQGSPQGSCLSSLIFLLMINDLPFCIHNGKLVIFADDSNLLNTGDPDKIPELTQKIEKDLQDIIEWTNRNHMAINLKKTQMIIIAKPEIRRNLQNLNIQCGDIKISAVKSMNFLD
ncbi:putative RNA-directed DNA polymerase from transposon BS [Orchesella cincta]|uniref:Putative RNA-directed DNA polymerase from transposon BS n=1 Tax=Orchesella cincta TaxID=48709 RepID=A0A1D2MHK5_ORCCI|nr:putative RNA-directed DNA polymerase from transposon BS [Orchesella cincta]